MPGEEHLCSMLLELVSKQDRTAKSNFPPKFRKVQVSDRMSDCECVGCVGGASEARVGDVGDVGGANEGCVDDEDGVGDVGGANEGCGDGVRVGGANEGCVDGVRVGCGDGVNAVRVNGVQVWCGYAACEDDECVDCVDDEDGVYEVCVSED